MIQTEFKQSHFVVYELKLPYCSVCTPADDLTEPWHTPVTCEESSDSEYSLWLTSNESPVHISQPTQSLPFKSILNSKVFKCVTNSSESTSKLKNTGGLGSRGTMSITCADFDGDPGPINFSDQGTFFGKLLARNILDGKEIVTHYYSVTNSGLVEVGTSTHFITGTQLNNGVFSLSAKDALKDIEAFSEKFPALSEITLAEDINSTQTVFDVNDASSFVAGTVFRIDDELFYVNSVSSNTVTVATRGSSLIGTDSIVVYKTNTSDHSTDSTIQPCYVMNKTFLPDVLEDIFQSVGLNDFVDYTQWFDEILEWNSAANLYGVFSIPEDISDLVDRLLKAYVVSMWLDQPSQKLQISAVSAWKESIRILEEGNDFSNFSIKTVSNERVSRAYMYNKKEFKAENDDIQNYSKLTIATDVATETSDFYGGIAVRELKENDFITTDSAQTTCARIVQRFSATPKEITFTMEERKLAQTGLSDIVDVISRDSQTPSGQFLQARDRAQVTRIQPVLNNIGRQYKVTCLSYIPLIASNPDEELVITLSGSLFDVNLFARAGAPNVPVNVSFVFDGATIGSTDKNVPSVRAGNFQSGSRIRIFCINNTKWSAIGGDGANLSVNVLGFGFYDYAQGVNGENGGDSYLSDGVESELYLNYSAHGYTASSELYAAGGGGASGGASGYINRGLNLLPIIVNSFNVGGGGSGIPSGRGGELTSFNQLLQETTKSSANDGGFDFGGSAIYLPGGSDSDSGRVVTATTTPISNGGSSLNANNITASASTNAGSDPNVSIDQTGVNSGGLAGGAIKGSNVTVYNLAADSGKFKPGNSDSYTLIDS